jgi:hypothetical protein
LSADGTKVSFTSRATNLKPADTDTIDDVYVKNLSTATLTLVSTSDADVKGDMASLRSSVSDDGARVVFESKATDLDPADNDANTDVYVKDLATGDINLASTSDAGVKGNASSTSPWLSVDGTTVAFDSTATNLDVGDTDGITDVYVKDLTTGDIVLASTSATGIKGDGTIGAASSPLSADGSEVAFSSQSRLVPGDQDSEVDIYVKNVVTGDITVASASSAGVMANSHSLGGSLADDGTRVAFYSYATNLDPADTDGIIDTYVKDLGSGALILASTDDNGIKGNGISGPPSLSGDGTRVSFDSVATNLDPADVSANGSVYVKDLNTPAPLTIGKCTNGDFATSVSIGSGAGLGSFTSYPSRPLDCPSFLPGAAPGDYADQTPVLIGQLPSPPYDSFTIAWGLGGTSVGVAKAKASAPGDATIRLVLVIRADGGKYASPSPAKTKIKGKVAFAAIDSFTCADDSDPIHQLRLSLPAENTLLAQQK